MRAIVRLLTPWAQSRGFGGGIAYLGLLLSFGAFAADWLGFGRVTTAWGWWQALGFGLGVALTLTGAALWLRATRPHWYAQAVAQARRWGGLLMARRRALVIAALLAAILLGSGAARFLRSYSGLPYLHVYDESQIAHSAIQMLKHGEADPKFFNYGSLLIYLNMGVDAAHYFYKMTVRDEPDALRTLSQVEVGAWGAWPSTVSYRWFVSHPSFYLWNRWLTALFGTGLVALAFVFGARAANAWAGLIAAAFLGAIEIHVVHSSYIATDVPSSFFVFLCVALSLGYLEQRGAGWLLGAAAAAGLAVGVKYNSAYVLLIPLLAQLVVGRGAPLRVQLWMWLAIPALAGGAFLISTPYALLNLPAFLDQAGGEVYHYTVSGHESYASVMPGLPHFALQIFNIVTNLHVVVLIFGLIGLPLLSASPAGRLLLVLGALSLILLSRTTVTFQRNLMVVYPIAAVAAGCGVAWVGQWLWAVTAPRRWGWALRGLSGLAILGICASALSSVIDAGVRARQTPETRSAAIDDLNLLAAQHQLAGTVVGIASELQMHPLDLRRIDHNLFYEQVPMRDLICRQASYSLLVLPAAPTQPLFKQYLESLAPERVRYQQPPPRAFVSSQPIANPAVAVAAPSAAAGATNWCQVPIDLADLSASQNAPIRTYQERAALVMRSNSTVTTAFYDLAPGQYRAQIEVGGSPAFDAYPEIAFTLLRRGGGPLAVDPPADGSPITLAGRYTPIAAGFVLTETAQVALRIAYTNDAIDRERNEDRNVYIAALGIIDDTPRAAAAGRPAPGRPTPLELVAPYDPATVEPCPAALPALPADVVAASATTRSSARWLQMTLRGTLQTAPCRLPAGVYGILWSGQGTREAALVRARTLVFDPVSGAPRTLQSRVLLLGNTAREWYEIFELRDEAAVALQLEWIDGAAYPDPKSRAIRLASSVQIRPYTQRSVASVLQRRWSELSDLLP